MVLSTIIICRNARPFIETCLNSVRSQTHTPDEILVVDGNSEDGTMEWLRQQTDIIRISQTGKGIANARNTGILAAGGDYLAFLDADDVWEPEKLALQLALLRQNPNLRAVTTLLTKSNDPDRTEWVAMTPGGFLFNRDVFDRFGLFNEEWMVASDHAWFIRAIRQGLTYEVVPQALLQKGMHDQNLSIAQQKRYRSELLTIMRQQQAY
ncbi:glycosyltransferase family A protein [Spirosoma panaciterrae]|uniref:glycosyltransferase family A protein n=1 Tax=Spirosoma panaciterrae TaxID=496058 RepID=UPI0003668A19|nr:glycosyltransferase family A protein [Spirosoma panaciterrae]